MNTCVSCGMEIPEGRLICPTCERLAGQKAMMVNDQQAMLTVIKHLSERGENQITMRKVRGQYEIRWGES